MLFVLNINHSPPVLSTSYWFSINDDISLRSNNCERNHVSDSFIELFLFWIVIIVVEGVNSNVVVKEFGANPLLESFPFLQSQTITLRNNRNYIDDLAQLLHHQDIDRLEGVTGRSDKVEAAVNASVNNVLVSHRC